MRRSVLLILGIAFWNSAPAGADRLNIQNGYVFVGNPSHTFGLDIGLFGNGFAFVGEEPFVHTFFADFSPTNPPFRLRLNPDEVIDQSSNSSCPGCGYGGAFNFQFASAGNASRPFSMTGTIVGYPDSLSIPLFRHQLIGGGTMVTSTTFVRFDFKPQAAPTPEPSTLFACAIGLALVARRGLRRRR
jgi:hypothetical protein